MDFASTVAPGMGAPAVLVTVPVRMSVVDPTWALDRDEVRVRSARTAARTARVGLSITGEDRKSGACQVGLKLYTIVKDFLLKHGGRRDPSRQRTAAGRQQTAGCRRQRDTLRLPSAICPLPSPVCSSLPSAVWLSDRSLLLCCPQPIERSPQPTR